MLSIKYDTYQKSSKTLQVLEICVILVHKVFKRTSRYAQELGLILSKGFDKEEQKANLRHQYASAYR
jgi:hypothetical protein